MKVRYKPYKYKAQAWSNYSEGSRVAENGREILCVGVALKLMEDDNGNITEEEVKEEIYKDILQSYFTSKDKYAFKIVPGKTPSVIITYDNNVIFHNEYVPFMAERIRTSIKSMKRELLVAAMVNYILNEKGLEKKNETYHEVANTVNKMCQTNFPEELIMLVIKDEFCDKERQGNPGYEYFRDMEYRQLLSYIANIALIGNCYEENFEKAVMTELMFRILQGEKI